MQNICNFWAPISYGNNLINSLQVANILRTKYHKRIRIGVSYGRVFAGIVGSKKRYTYTVIGDSVNIAARLMGRCGEGEIWVDENVYERGKNIGEFTVVGNLKLKGKGDIVKVYKLNKVGKEKRGMQIPLFGRHTEISTISEYLENKLKSKRNFGKILVKGEQGVGKTALFSEIERRFKDRITFIKVNAVSDEGKIFRDILLSIFGETARDIDIFDKKWRNFAEYANNESLKFAYPFIKYVLTGDEEEFIKRSDPSHLKESIKFSIKEVLKGASNIFPFIIVFDNVYSDKEELLKWIDMVFREVEEYRFGFFFTTKDKEGVIDSCNMEIELKELEDEDIIEIIKFFFDDNIHEIFAFVKNKCGGNPLFIVEALRYLKERYGEKVRTLENIPSTLEDIVLSRIDMFERDMKKIIYYAAAMGHEFRTDVLGKIFNSDIDVYLDLGIKKGLWEQQKENIYIFSQNILRNVVYGVLLPSQLRKIHYDIARTMKNLFDKNSYFYKDIASHYYLSDRKVSATKFYKKSLEYALNNYYMKEAMDIVERLIEITHDNKYYLKKLEIMKNMALWGEIIENRNAYSNLFKGNDYVKFKLLLGNIYIQKEESMINFMN